MAVRKGFKVALPGYDATTDNDPNHHSLFVDQLVDYILIKEKAHAVVNVSGSTHNIAHGLGYVPFCLVFAEVSIGQWRKLFSRNIDSTGIWFEINSTNLVLNNTTGSPVNFSYRIFYDNIT